ncbi:hypothetical protein CLU79DRAFT_840891 [Phycomyces nitens]|nr:hypothetical protein CLU79DRAFT_840891 [Phycomyces nitens]
MSLQTTLAALGDKIANLQISDDANPGESGSHLPTPMTGVEFTNLVNEASLPPKKRGSYRVVSLESPSAPKNLVSL